MKSELISKSITRFEYIVTFLIVNFRFVHQILGLMDKTPDFDIDTMGVWVSADGRFHLKFSPVFMDKLTQPMATWCLYHEVLHLALLHCTKRKLGDSLIVNVAQDLAVNELIPDIVGACERPRDKKGNLIACHVDEFKKQKKYEDIQSNQTAEWYLDYLREKEKKDGGKGKNKGKGNQKGMNNFDSHKGWQEHEIANEKVAAKIREVSQMNTWGDNVSQGCIEAILAAQIKKINWRNLIRTWFGNQAWKDRIYTRKKPNRRTGLMHPGTRRSYVDRWLVAVDTSGSIDKELLSEFLAVLNQLADELPIDFMQFDWNTTQQPKLFDRRQLSLEFKGRGGTNFQPVMDIVEEKKYKGVMILTDGEAAKPTRPTMAKVLWVLPEGCNPPVDWGHRIHMQKHV